MIGADDSILSGEILISEDDARKLRLGSGGTVCCRADETCESRYVSYLQRKVPILGIPSPDSIPVRC
jgi:hypothetical protein